MVRYNGYTSIRTSYFSYGIFPALPLEVEYANKYGIELIVIGQGCIGGDLGHCYNQALFEYLGIKVN